MGNSEVDGTGALAIRREVFQILNWTGSCCRVFDLILVELMVPVLCLSCIEREVGRKALPWGAGKADLDHRCSLPWRCKISNLYEQNRYHSTHPGSSTASISRTCDPSNVKPGYLSRKSSIWNTGENRMGLLLRWQTNSE